MFRDVLRHRLPELSAEKVALLEAHYDLLVRWNKTINLTSISGLEAIVERHYCESIFLSQHLPPEPVSIADIGSGGGFPGIPVAVLRPDCTVTLIESHRRKAVFLQESVRKLANVRVLAARVEDVTGHFDMGISRAVSYQDLEPGLRKLASKAILLSGEEPPPDSLGFVWDVAIMLPWGNRGGEKGAKRRFLRVGVSRETGTLHS